MLLQLGKFEPQVLVILVTATIIIGLMRLGIYGATLTAWIKLHSGLKNVTKSPFIEFCCLILGALASCLILHFRITHGKEYDSFKEFSMQNRSLLECIVYMTFVLSFAWINTRLILAYGSHLLKIMKSKLPFKPTHSAVWAFLGFSFGHFANFIWFHIAQLSASVSSKNTNGSHKLATGTDFAGSLAPVLLTGIIIICANLMNYFENQKHAVSR